MNLDQNPWEHPPEPIVAGGVPAVRKYFEAVYTGGTTAVSRPLKVVIVGKETVGKTRYEMSAYMYVYIVLRILLYAGMCTLKLFKFW